MRITNDIKYVGVNDHEVDLFEGQYVVENGMSYNSYVILDEKIAVMDTVDARFTHEWLDNIQNTIGSRHPDYLIVQHMEPEDVYKRQGRNPLRGTDSDMGNALYSGIWNRSPLEI